MPPKAQKQVVFKIDTPEKFQDIISSENHKLVVIDLHLAWCGPCSVMVQNFTSFFFAQDNADNRIQFWQCSEEVVPPEFMKTLKYGELTCKPRFLIYLEGEKKDEVVGADFCKIESSCLKYIPVPDE